MTPRELELKAELKRVRDIAVAAAIILRAGVVRDEDAFDIIYEGHPHGYEDSANVDDLVVFLNEFTSEHVKPYDRTPDEEAERDTAIVERWEANREEARV